MNNLLSFDVDAACAIVQASKVTFPKISMGTIDGVEMQTVNMRDLHEKLGVKREFSHWVQDVLEGFTRGEDFEVFVKNGENPSAGGRPRKEYVATLDVAKHAAMLSRTEAGKKIRQYFINAEKDLQRSRPNAQTQTQLSTFDVMRIAIDRLEGHEAELKNHAGRIEAIETKLLPGATMHHAECPADSEIKSRALRRKRRETGMSLAICERVFDLYADNMWKGETCANPNPAVPGNKPCRAYKIRDINAAFRHFLRFVKPVGNGFYADKDLPTRFRVPCLDSQ